MNNQPLVFIHGSGDTREIWQHQVAFFGEQHTYALDLPGHGERPDSEPTPTTIGSYALAVYTIITEELHLERPFLVGNSLGGAIALWMGLEYRDQIAGLIIIGSGARLRVLPSLLTEAQEQPQQARERLTKLALSPANEETLAPAILHAQQPADPGILYRDLNACNQFDIMNRLQEIAVPVLVIGGREDRLTPVKYSQYLCEHLTDASLCLIADAGHYVMWEQPQAVNSAIADWLVERGG